MESAAEVIRDGKAVLGIEFGSTRIKAVLVDGKCKPIASGSHEWENRLEHGYWTYSLEDIWAGLQDAYKNLKEDVRGEIPAASEANWGLWAFPGYDAWIYGI